MAVLTPSFLPNVAYPFGPSAGKIPLRYTLEQLGLQEGVIGATTALAISQRTAGGAGMFVDVAAGGAWIKGDDTARQGYYHAVNDAVVTLAITANASGNPRLDQIIARVYDSNIAGVVDGFTLEVLAGTPTATANRTNRLGAAALPNGAIRLGDVEVANGAVSILNANIADRRLFAEGASYNASFTMGTSNLPTALTLVDAAARRRLEVSGLWPVRVKFQGSCFNGGASTHGSWLGMVNTSQKNRAIWSGTSYASPILDQLYAAADGLAAGSNLFEIQMTSNVAATWAFNNGAGWLNNVEFAELVGQSAGNINGTA